MSLTKRTRRNITGAVALLAGSLVIFLGDKLLGVHIELWLGLMTFSPAWILDVFLVPAIAGFVVAIIFGLGGKWLCYFPPVIVRVINYSMFAYFQNVPDNAELLTVPFWILFVILAVEAAAFGGVFGEIFIKRTYGRMPRDVVYRRRSGNQP
jgi:hypothetical protein